MPSLMGDSPGFPKEGGSELRLKDGDPKGESSVHSPCDEGCEGCRPGLPGGGTPRSKSLFPPASPAFTVPCVLQGLCRAVSDNHKPDVCATPLSAHST